VLKSEKKLEDKHKVEARFNLGILGITMPKAESAQSKRIQIES
jgi:HSP20 family molecular chaperone IbpA